MTTIYLDEPIKTAIIKTLDWCNIKKTDDEITEFYKNILLKDVQFLDSFKDVIKDE